jgi:hypothetical protein
VVAALLAIGCFSNVASASPIKIGVFSFDDLGGEYTFNITNLTGLAAVPPDYPVETALTFDVTSLTASTEGGGTLTLGTSAFTTDPFGNVNCTAAGDASTGGCNFAAHALVSATLVGTLAPISGLTGLPPGFSGIVSSFSVTVLPTSGPTLAPGDFADIEATPVPEPSTLMLVQLGVGALGAYKLRRNPRFLQRFTRRVE